MNENIQSTYEKNGISISEKKVSDKKAIYFIDDIQGIEVKRDYLQNFAAIILTIISIFLLLKIISSDPWTNNNIINLILKGIALLFSFAMFAGSLMGTFRKHAKVLFIMSGKKRNLGGGLDIEEANKIKETLVKIKSSK